MKLLHSPTLAVDLKDKFLLLDCTVFVDASKSDEFLELLSKLSEQGCNLVTIPSVVYEFTRNSNTIDGFNKRQEFINALKVVVLNRIEEGIDKEGVFKIAYAKAFSKKGEGSNKGPSYTDALLCSVAYKHRNSEVLLMTANHKDIPLAMFDRTEIVTIDVEGQLRTEAIYKLSASKLNDTISKLV